MSQTVLMDQFFKGDVKTKADAIVARYETRRASILEILRLLQEDYGYVTLEMEEAVAQYIGIPPIDVREVMTFYTLFYDNTKAKTRFHVCRTLSCALTGGEEITRYLESKLGIRCGQKTKDGQFSLNAVECLGACEIAPMLQLNDVEYVGQLTKEKVNALLQAGGYSGAPSEPAEGKH